MTTDHIKKLINQTDKFTSEQLLELIILLTDIMRARAIFEGKDLVDVTKFERK